MHGSASYPQFWNLKKPSFFDFTAERRSYNAMPNFLRTFLSQSSMGHSKTTKIFKGLVAPFGISRSFGSERLGV